MTIATKPRYSREEIEAVMRETDRLLAADKRLTKVANARASAGTKPPTAREVYFTYIGQAMDRGLTKREAMLELAKEKPDLHAAFVQEEQKIRQDRLGREQKEKSAARRHRNR